MRKLLMLGAVTALLVPAASDAAYSLGLRLGFAPAGGESERGSKMADGVKSQIPVQLDALYELTPEIAAGLYLSYGFGQLDSRMKDACEIVPGASCSASVIRLGIQGTYTFNAVSRQLVPWAGVGAGVEWLSQKVAIDGLSGSADTAGLEFLNVQFGGDYRVNEQFSVGPYVLVSLGQYWSVEGDGIPAKSLHEWFDFGVRGKFDL